MAKDSEELRKAKTAWKTFLRETIVPLRNGNKGRKEIEGHAWVRILAGTPEKPITYDTLKKIASDALLDNTAAEYKNIFRLGMAFIKANVGENWDYPKETLETNGLAIDILLSDELPNAKTKSQIKKRTNTNNSVDSNTDIKTYISSMINSRYYSENVEELSRNLQGFREDEEKPAHYKKRADARIIITKNERNPVLSWVSTRLYEGAEVGHKLEETLDELIGNNKLKPRNELNLFFERLHFTDEEIKIAEKIIARERAQNAQAQISGAMAAGDDSSFVGNLKKRNEPKTCMDR